MRNIEKSILIKSDLTIVGGGIAGITCAITAARHGLKVALIESRDVLGGNSSSEYRVAFCGSGAVNSSFYARESGIVDEIKLNIFHKQPMRHQKMEYDLADMALLQLVLNEPNISLFLGTPVYGAKNDGNQICEVYARKIRTEEEYVFSSPFFADGSGDGILGYCAGAEFRYGRESRSEFNESLAPDQADSCTMGSSILFLVAKATEPVLFVKPEFAYDYQKDKILDFCNRPDTGRVMPEKINRDPGLWWLSVGGMQDSIQDDSQIDFELKRLVYGFWDYVKNSGEYKDVDNLYIEWIAPHLAKRESRRFIGDYILNENDIKEQRDFYDSVATGGWSLDLHDPAGVYGEGCVSAFGHIHGVYNIPYRTMYSRNIENLFLLGRIASATHVALGSIRVMATLGTMGQAAGTAAYLCKKYGVLPKNISQPDKVAELQNILQRDGQYIVNKQEDVGLASKAMVTASGTLPFENEASDLEISLHRSLIMALPLPTKTLENIDFKVKNTGERTALSVKLYSAYAETNYETDKVLETIEIPLEKGFDGWITLTPTKGVFPNRLALIGFDKNEDIVLYGGEEHMIGAPLFYPSKADIGGRYRTAGGKFASLAFKNVSFAQELYQPLNVLNGISRPVALPNCWKGAIRNQPTLRLDFQEPCDAQEIQILLNGQLEKDIFSGKIETLPSKFTVEIGCKAGIIKKEVDGNFLALHRFYGDYKELRYVEFKFIETYGSTSIEVYAVKVF